MDRPLSSDRGARDNHYGPGGGGGGGFQMGGGGPRPYNNNYRGGRGRGGRGGGFRGHRRDGRGRGGGGGNRRSGNRFQPENNPQDRQQSVLTNLLKALNQVGHVKLTPEEEQAETTTGEERAIVKKQAANIQGLTNVVCGTPDVFLKYKTNNVVRTDRIESSSDDRPTADSVAGPLAVGVVHAVAAWPFQTPCYATLTLCIHEKSSTSSFAGFGARTVEYAVRVLARDLDSLLLQKASPLTDSPRAVMRSRLVLRYLANLATCKMVASDAERDQAVPAATTQRPVSLLGLMEALVQAAVQAVRERYQHNTSVACVLAVLVWSTIPYLKGVADDQFIAEVLLQPLEEVSKAYKSDFAPGIGARAILLQEEQIEDMDGDEEEEEEDDEEEDDDEGASGQVCDSWQDLIRAVQHVAKEPDAPLRLALFSDAPWQAIQTPEAPPATDGEATEPPETVPLEYSGEPLALAIFPTCRSLTLLLGGEVAPDVGLARVDISGLVYGRLPIFGAPAGVDDEEDDDEDMQDEGPKNERLDSYKASFGLIDRYFLSETVRDCLLGLESSVSDTGVDRGNLKAVAEQVWSLCSMVKGEDTKGLEFCILETILSLIVQSSTSSPYRLVYLSRVVLELTRLEPAIMSGAIALAVSNLFQDYMPALVPSARYNLSRWFAFHLINTDYQWPAAFWKSWEPFVSYGWKNSRGAFVKRAIAIMVENLSNPELLVMKCLPKESTLSSMLLPTRPESQLGEDNPLASMANEIETRIWDSHEDPSLLLSYLIGDEVSETALGALDIEGKGRLWWRTGILLHSLLAPLRREYDEMLAGIEKAKSATEDSMEEEIVIHDDSLPTVVDAMARYKIAILGVLAKDAESLKDDRDLRGETGGEVGDLVPGQIFLLEQLEASTFYSTAVHVGCLQALLEQQVVSVKSIFHWALGDMEGGAVQLRWWETVLSAIRFDLHGIVLESEDSSKMVLDGVRGDDESSFPEAHKILSYLDPLLSYGARRVENLLHKKQDDSKGKKLTPEQVELVEGFKILVVECHSLFFSATKEMCGEVSISLTTKLFEALSESAIAGPKLAALVGEGDNYGVSVLHRSLERMP